MTKEIIRVFPDYCSSGVWGSGDNRGNMDPEELGISEGLQLALKYWHDYWEATIVQFDENGESIRIGQYYIDKWITDGKKLCELMTAENDRYEFVYVA